jgi:predicted RNA binding protein YcfA (HicA-like mRNA interferase family)
VRLPRDLSGQDLVKALANYDYVVDRQTGSNIRLTTHLNGEHHITVSAHIPLKVGTLNAIFRDVAEHFDLSKDELINQLF